MIEKAPVWNILQEPARPSRFTPGYMLLLAAVDSGWSISEPVFMHADSQDSSICSYAFVLTNSRYSDSQHLIVPQCRDVDGFIHSEGLTVIDDCSNGH